MEVNKPEAAVPAARDQSQKKNRDILSEENEEQENGKNDHRGEDDGVEIAVGFAAAITPEVQRFLDDLAGELERHPYLPVLNRHGLGHEMARVVGHIQGLGAAAFFCISVLSAEELRQQYGRQVYENAMTHACTILATVVNSSDIIGCLGGHDLGVIALAPNDDVIETLAHDFRAALSVHRFDRLGTAIVLEVAVGGVMLNRGQGFAAALQAADEDMLG